MNTPETKLPTPTGVGSSELLCGWFVIIETHEMREWWRRPRSGKQRIREKWMKNPANWRPRKDVLRMGRKLICHPVVARQLRRQLETAQQKGSGMSDSLEQPNALPSVPNETVSTACPAPSELPASAGSVTEAEIQKILDETDWDAFWERVHQATAPETEAYRVAAAKSYFGIYSQPESQNKKGQPQPPTTSVADTKSV